MSLICFRSSVITQFVRMPSYERIQIHSNEFIRTSVHAPLGFIVLI